MHNLHIFGWIAITLAAGTEANQAAQPGHQSHIYEWLTIAALMLGPLLALQVQRMLDNRREAKNRRLWVFRTLMMNRATNMNPDYIRALNLIDLTFDSDKESKVREAWKLLLDGFGELGAAKEKEAINRAYENCREFTVSLFQVMGLSLGYKFDKVDIKKATYYPKGLTDVEEEQHALRKKVLELLDGSRRLPVGVFEDKFPDIKA
jgi:hypothetical protein